MSYKANPTDKEQSELEAATFEGGVPVFMNEETRVVAKVLHTGAYRTQHRTTEGGQGSNAGVVLPFDDQPNRFVSETQGKA